MNYRLFATQLVTMHNATYEAIEEAIEDGDAEMPEEGTPEYEKLARLGEAYELIDGLIAIFGDYIED